MSDIVERLKKASTSFDIYCAAVDEIQSLRHDLAQAQERVKELEEKCRGHAQIEVALRNELAALKAAPAGQRTADLTIPDGWQLVPIEPTEEMKKHGCNEGATAYADADGIAIEDLWKAMLAAAPKPSQQAAQSR